MHAPDREHVRRVPAADDDHVLREHELAHPLGRPREEAQRGGLRAAAKALVEKDDQLGVLARCRGDVEDARPAREPEDVVVEQPRLLFRVSPAAHADELGGTPASV